MSIFGTCPYCNLPLRFNKNYCVRCRKPLVTDVEGKDKSFDWGKDKDSYYTDITNLQITKIEKIRKEKKIIAYLNTVAARTYGQDYRYTKEASKGIGGIQQTDEEYVDYKEKSVPADVIPYDLYRDQSEELWLGMYKLTRPKESQNTNRKNSIARQVQKERLLYTSTFDDTLKRKKPDTFQQVLNVQRATEKVTELVKAQTKAKSTRGGVFYIKELGMLSKTTATQTNPRSVSPTVSIELLFPPQTLVARSEYDTPQLIALRENAGTQFTALGDPLDITTPLEGPWDIGPQEEAYIAQAQETSSTMASQVADAKKKLTRKRAMYLGLGIWTAQAMATMATEYGAPYGLKPEAIIGPVPLYSVQSMERAKSDRKLKNRAVGDVFLAHQKGNRDIFKVDGTLTGPFRYIYLWMLIQLQKTGQGKEVNLTQGNILQANALTDLTNKVGAKTNALNYEEHRTFPIITQFQIMSNMYLQTIEWHRSVEDGLDVIKYHLLFRKWFRPHRFEVFNSSTSPNLIEGAQSFSMTSEVSEGRWEFALDSVWKTARTLGEVWGHIVLGSDGIPSQLVKREALYSIKKLVDGYGGGLFNLA